MGLTYTGDATFQETESSGGMTVDLWGADVLTREWAGKKSDLDTFLSSFRITISGFFRDGTPIVLDRSRQIQDSQLPDLFLTELAITNDRSWARVRGTFKGVTNGRKPKPKITYGKKAQQVTLPFIGDELGVPTGINTSFLYSAPHTTFMYVTKRKPRGPLFKGRTEFIEDALQITARTGTGGSVKYFRGRSLTSNISNVSSAGIAGGLNAFNAVVECVNTTFDVVPIGAWWEVTEVNEITLNPLDIDGWTYQLG